MSRSASRSGRKSVADYLVEGEIGQGGMGVVYLAYQDTLERAVALKQIRRELLQDEVAVERFRREACAAAAIHHQNVVAVYDAFRWRNDLYIAQELVDGQDLRAILERGRRLHPEIAALIALEVVRGLEEIHARGIVHRDIKPGNILIGWEGETKIADFGIALADGGSALTRPGLMIGSLPYMSPEQILGEPLDQRSDLFLLGILLYEMIAGVAPFQESTDDSSDTLLQRMRRQQFTPLRRVAPQAPRWLARLVRTCLRGQPAKRPASSTALRRGLEHRLGSSSPADCRRRIAVYLRERGVLEPLQDHTALRPSRARRHPPAAARRWPTWLATLPPTARRGALIAAAVPLAMAAAIWGPRPAWLADPVDPPVLPTTAPRAAGETPLLASLELDPGIILEPVAGSGAVEEAGAGEPAAPATGMPEDLAAPPAAARLRFLAQPWAEITVDDLPPFLTPRARALEVLPGPHRVVFTHPTYGRAEVEIEVQPGEERLLRQIFPQDADG